MVKQTGGVGGYGAIWTLNQDQRQGRYEPHKTIVRTLDRMVNIYHVKCLDCGEEWDHPINDRTFPEKCVGKGTKPAHLTYDEDLHPKHKTEVEEDEHPKHKT